MDIGVLLKLVSIGLSIWAIRYYWKTHQPLDERSRRVRWVGMGVSVALYAMVFTGFRFLASKQWLHAHTNVIVVVGGVPALLFFSFLMVPGFSRWVAAQCSQ